MPTATAKPRWKRGDVAIRNTETKKVFHRPGIVQGNIGIFHWKSDTGGQSPFPWYVYHQPSGLGFFRTETLALAKQIIGTIRDRWGLDFCDRFAKDTQTPDDERIGREVREFVLSHPRTKRY